MTAPICGHDREALRWALRIETAPDRIEFVTTNVAPYDRPREPDDIERVAEQCRVAHQAIRDPAKLAAIIAELLRGAFLGEYYAAYPKRCPADTFGVWLDSYHDTSSPIIVQGKRLRWQGRLSMSQARRFALALLDAPADANVEQMIAKVYDV